MKRFLGAVFLGALISMAWNTVSWTFLPWRTSSIQSFNSEKNVAQALLQEAPKSGIYVLPKGMNEESFLKKKNGPYMFAFIRKGMKLEEMPMIILKGFLIQLFGALLIVSLLSLTQGLSSFMQVVFITSVAAAGGVLSHLSYWNWWEIPTYWTFLYILDMLIAWFLAGIAMVKILQHRPKTFYS